MFYRCKDCGGNAVYDPKKKKMVCESCGNEETQEKILQEKPHICNNCGAEIESKKTDLALKCPYCGTYVIFEDRMKDAYKPDLALPFVIDRKEAIEIIRKNFAKKMFIPKDFCSTSSLESLQGRYVPFWMYVIWRPMCILKEKEEKSERGQKETMIVRRRVYIVL